MLAGGEKIRGNQEEVQTLSGCCLFFRLGYPTATVL